MNLSRICLGAAQLGMRYGINSRGKPSRSECAKIVSFALANGVTAFDTAPAYGDSEQILGACLREYAKEDLIIISKIPSQTDVQDVRKAGRSMAAVLERTLNRLRIETLPVWLFHRFSDAVRDDQVLWELALQFRKEGRVQNIGVSIYTPSEAEAAVELPEIDVLEVPCNALDKRLQMSGFFGRARRQGVAVLARSVFLQGLLLKELLVHSLSEVEPYRTKLRGIAAVAQLSLAEVALRYVLSLSGPTSVIVGVDSVGQIAQNLASAGQGALPDSIVQQIDEMGTAPEHIIDPRLWRLD